MARPPELLTPPMSWYQDLVRGALDHAIISMDPAGIITAWNPGAMRLFYHAEAEVIGRPIDLIFTSEDIRADVPSKERDHALHHETALDERWHVRKDNTRVWASGRLFVVRDTHGEIRGFAKIIQDRTRAKSVHDTLVQSEERYRLLSRATNDVIWDWNLTTGELTWNDAAETHFKFPREQLNGDLQGWSARVHPDDVDRVKGSLLAAVAHGATTWSERYRFRLGDDTYAMFYDRGTIARDPDGRALRMIGSMLEITSDNRTEAALREAQTRIERQNAELEARVQQRTAELRAALRDLEEFSYSMSHDLKGPANTIRALVEILWREAPPAEEARDIVRRTFRNAVVLCDLINEMLRFSEIGLATAQVEVIDLDEFMAQAVAELHAGPRSQGSHIELRPLLGRVLADRVLLGHAVRHLLTNAVTFVAAGVSPQVAVFSDRSEARVRLHVEDNGIGIDPRFRDQIFELFRRLHHAGAYPGHGVGLATVKRAMEKLSGSVSFESVLGHGSVFTLDLPAAR